ncbi:hypothetical protein TNCT_662251 [Trichonephila clavata]|uniref:Uncharacterized protein n=1 Tax=Trichonephila clavata TaxID=2740835 RepID=A0A8X6F9S8_TRICU|nr:hypothetical protein TNCT_662251 [Trichonephila clavata]
MIHSNYQNLKRLQTALGGINYYFQPATHRTVLSKIVLRQNSKKITSSRSLSGKKDPLRLEEVYPFQKGSKASGLKTRFATLNWSMDGKNVDGLS